MKKQLATYLLICLFHFSVQAQSYDDVAILINSDSPTSIEIGTYFQAKHNIPDERVIQLSMSSKKVINVEEATALLAELNPVMELLDGINYIVTTKGCPTSFDPENEISQLHDSFEVLIRDREIGAVGTPPLDFAAGDFTFDEFGIYIVSRLEARTIEGTKAFIDRGGQNNLNSQNPLMLDLVHEVPYYDSLALEYVSNFIEIWKEDNEGNLIVPVQLDLDTTIHMIDSHLSGYLGYILGDLTTERGEEIICKTEGISMLLNSFGALDTLEDLYLSPLDFNESSCHGAVGVVDQHYVAQTRRTMDVFKYYYDPNLTYNLGESFLLAQHINFKNAFVLYGDPKSTVSFVSGINNFPSLDFEIEIYPNPFSSFIQFNASRKLGGFMLEIFSIDGKKIMTKSLENIENEKVDVSHLPSAEYIIRTTTNSLRKSYIFIKQQ